MTECSKCGRCCKYICTALPPKEEYDYWFLHGAETIDRLHGVMLIKARCKWLTGNNTCLHYEKRPELCKRFPKDSPLGLLKALRCSM